MDGVVVGVCVLVGVILLTPAATALRVPQPVVLTIYGLLLAAIPVVPDLQLSPELILPIVLPPLLFAATQRTTVTEFREHAGAVAVLAVGLTVSTAAVVALTAHALGLSWATAWILGAVVSPPDPVAATAVARRLSLPHRLVTILEGEGMFNDATALVLYSVAVTAAVSGSITVVDIGVDLLAAVVLGVLAGLLAAVVARWLLARIHDGYAETTITVLFPFVAYVGAEEVHGSGVLAVLVLGLYLRSYGHAATTSGGWLLGRAVWSYADFLVTSVVFALLGFELFRVIGQTPVDSGTMWLAVAVVSVLVVFRAAWVFVSSGFARHRARRRDVPLPSGWRESLVVSWAGMRGVVTVATALALPLAVKGGAPLEGRNDVIAVGLACVLLTLVVQGLTLAPLTTRLGVGSEVDEERMVADLRRQAAQKALEEIRGAATERAEESVCRAAVMQYEGYVAAQSAMEEARLAEHDDVDLAEQLGALLRHATDVERALVLEKRRSGEVSAAVADEVLRDIETRAVRDFD